MSTIRREHSDNSLSIEKNIGSIVKNQDDSDLSAGLKVLTELQVELEGYLHATNDRRAFRVREKLLQRLDAVAMEISHRKKKPSPSPKVITDWIRHRNKITSFDYYDSKLKQETVCDECGKVITRGEHRRILDLLAGKRDKTNNDQRVFSSICDDCFPKVESLAVFKSI